MRDRAGCLVEPIVEPELLHRLNHPVQVKRHERQHRPLVVGGDQPATAAGRQLQIVGIAAAVSRSACLAPSPPRRKAWCAGRYRRFRPT